MLYPTIKFSQARKSVELLKRLGLIFRGEDGRYQLSKRVIKAGEKAKHVALRRFHAGFIKLADNALEAIPSDKRNISSLTLGIRMTHTIKSANFKMT